MVSIHKYLLTGVMARNPHDLVPYSLPVACIHDLKHHLFQICMIVYESVAC